MTSALDRCPPPLFSTIGGDPDFGELVELFVEEMPGRVENFLDLMERGDWDELRRSAHQLKGAAGGYGFGPIGPAAAGVEDAIRDGLPEEQVRSTVAELVALCSRARAGSPD